jgi:hypothetical protein
MSRFLNPGKQQPVLFDIYRKGHNLKLAKLLRKIMVDHQK